MHLINKDNEFFFAENGYLKLENFIDENQLQQLGEIYSNSLLGKANGKMYSNFHDLSFEENQAIKKSILDVCKNALDNFLQDYTPVGAAFIVKGTGSESDSRLHQDWSIVDEKKYKSLIVWIPLIDVDEVNGCLQVVPGSHKWFYTIRSSSVSSIFLKFNNKINPFIKSLPLKKTECALFDMKVFHGSKSNSSEIDRPAVTLTLIDKGAHYVHYLKDDQENIQILDCNEEAVYHNSFNVYNGKESKAYNILGKLEHAAKYQIEEKDFLNKLYKENSGFNIFKRVWFSIISYF